MPKKRPPNKISEIESETTADQQDNDDIIIPPSLETFLQAAGADDQEIRVILYRREPAKPSGRPKRFFLEEYEGNPPGLHEIGSTHGSGEYEIIAVGKIEKRTGKPSFLKTISFNIDKRYDRIRDEREKKLHPELFAAPHAPAQDAQMQFQQGLSMITALMQAIAPLISSQQQQQPNPAAMFQAMSEIGNGLLSNSFKTQMENQKIMMDTIRDAAPGLSGSNDNEEDKTFDRIMQALEMFLPMFIKSPAALHPGMIAAAKATPDVKHVLESTASTNALKEKLIAKFGKEQAEKLFEIFDKKNGRKKQTAGIQKTAQAAG